MFQFIRFSTLLIIFVISSSVLAIGDAVKGKTLSKTCVACHGSDGNSLATNFPKIAGQYSSYLFKQLKDFKSSKRVSALMTGIVAPLSEQDMLDLSAYFSKQTISANVAKGDEKLLILGERLYRGGSIKSGVPACGACHGPRGNGIDSAKFPQLSSQHAKYTKIQLKAFRQDSVNQQFSDNQKPARTNDINKMMRQVVANLTDVEINALSQYIAGLH